MLEQCRALVHLDLSEAEIEVSQRWALPQHSCKTLCPSMADVTVTDIKVHQRWALCQHSSCKPLCKWSCNCNSVL